MIRFIEELSFSAVPSDITHLYDGWVLRVSDGVKKRANSVNPIYVSYIDLDKKISHCRKFYEERHRSVIYKITSDPVNDTLDYKLNILGYKKIDETSVMIRDITDVTDICYLEDCEILKNIDGKKINISCKIENRIIGSGYGVIDSGYVGIFDIYVEKEFRNMGYGNLIVSKICGSSLEYGSQKAYLQVVMENKSALRLYKKLGFRELYKYWYRK